MGAPFAEVTNPSFRCRERWSALQPRPQPVLCGAEVNERGRRSGQAAKPCLKKPTPTGGPVNFCVKTDEHGHEFSIGQNKPAFNVLASSSDLDRLECDNGQQDRSAARSVHATAIANPARYALFLPAEPKRR